MLFKCWNNNVVLTCNEKKTNDTAVRENCLFSMATRNLQHYNTITEILLQIFDNEPT